MELSELEDTHDKVVYHCSEVENNLDTLSSLIESMGLEAYFLEEIRQSLRTAYYDIEQKYDQLKEELAKGD